MKTKNLNSTAIIKLTEDMQETSLQELATTTKSSYDSTSHSTTEIAKLTAVEIEIQKFNEKWKHRQHLNDDKNNKLSFIQFLIMIFVITSGAGPFGIESSVSSVGICYTLLGLILVPIFYALPQCLMVAEMSSMMPTNHGYISWVYRAFSYESYGDFIGFINGLNCVSSTGFASPIYILLMYDYIRRLLEDEMNLNELNFTQEYFIKLSIIVIGAIFNIINIRNLGNLSIIVAIIVVSPFIFGTFYTIINGNMDPSTQWFDTKAQNSNHEYNFMLALSTLIWLYSGCDIMGCLIGEIKFRKKLLFLPFFIAVICDYLIFTVSLIGAATVDCNDIETGNVSCWDNGFLYNAYNHIYSGLGIFIIISAIFSNFGLYVVNLSGHVRSLWAISQPYITILDSYEYDSSDDLTNIDNDITSNIIFNNLNILERQIKINILPQNVFGTINNRTKTPIKAVLLQSLINSILILFTFKILVETSVFLQVFAFFFEYGAFLKLRYSEPNIPRPFKVIGGLCGAWSITILKFIIILMLLILSIIQEPYILLIAVGFNIIIILWYLFSRIYFKSNKNLQSHSLMYSSNENSNTAYMSMTKSIW